MSPRFLARMESQKAMQIEWHRHNSSPPSYPQSMQQHPQQTTPVSSTESLPAHNNYEEPPSYQKISRSRSAPPAYIQRQTSHPDPIIGLYSFPPRSTILVVGAYTRQGMHIIDRLIENGHSVRGIVSSAREAAQVSKHFEASHGRGYYHSSIVTDLTVEGALDSTARHCSGVVFVTSQSSPIMMSTEERIANVLNTLTSAVKEVRMDRFIYCSSACSPAPVAAAAPRPTPLNNQISTIDEEEDAEVDESVASLYHAISSATQQPRRPSRWLSNNSMRSRSRSRSGSRSRSSLEERGGGITEETPVEIAIGRWVELWEPKFALQTGKLPSPLPTYKPSYQRTSH
jgi:hypothetical protein